MTAHRPGDPCPDCTEQLVDGHRGGARCSGCYWTNDPPAPSLDFRTAGQRTLEPVAGGVAFAVVIAIGAVLVAVGLPLVVLLLVLLAVLGAGFAALQWVFGG